MNIPKKIKEKIAIPEDFEIVSEYILGLLESDEAIHLMKHPGNISEITGATLMSGKKWAEFIRTQIEKDGGE